MLDLCSNVVKFTDSCKILIHKFVINNALSILIALICKNKSKDFGFSKISLLFYFFHRIFLPRWIFCAMRQKQVRRSARLLFHAIHEGSCSKLKKIVNTLWNHCCKQRRKQQEFIFILFKIKSKRRTINVD